MNLKEIENKINSAVDKLYRNDCFLFDGNLCERCINHRFAMYLEEQNFGKGYFVDCEYNKSYLDQGSSLKRVSNENGNYIDIIITKRDGNYSNDFLCFEIKKWNNFRNRDKDVKNLKILTEGRRFAYDYGFHIIWGETKEKTKIEIYKGGQLIEK